jgi:hypothetical protein
MREQSSETECQGTKKPALCVKGRAQSTPLYHLLLHTIIRASGNGEKPSGPTDQVFGLKLRSDIQNRFLSWAYTVPNSLKKAYPESTVSVVAVIRTHSKPFRAGLSMGNCRKNENL